MDKIDRTVKPKDRILEAASNLFYERGFSGVGVDEIVVRSGVAKMTLYKHFPSKDDLAAEVVRSRGKAWLDWFISRTRARTGDPTGRLLAMFDVLEEWFARPDFRGCTNLNVSAEQPRPEHPLRLLARQGKFALLKEIESLAREAGVEQPAELAEQWLLLVDGAIASAQLWGIAGPARRARQVAKRLLDS